MQQLDKRDKKRQTVEGGRLEEHSRRYAVMKHLVGHPVHGPSEALDRLSEQLAPKVKFRVSLLQRLVRFIPVDAAEGRSKFVLLLREIAIKQQGHQVGNANHGALRNSIKTLPFIG